MFSNFELPNLAIHHFPILGGYAMNLETSAQLLFGCTPHFLFSKQSLRNCLQQAAHTQSVYNFSPFSHTSLLRKNYLDKVVEGSFKTQQGKTACDTGNDELNRSLPHQALLPEIKGKMVYSQITCKEQGQTDYEYDI